MSGPPEPIPEEVHVLAGEYVLGALDMAEMRAVRRQAMVDPTLASAIAGWEARLTPIAAVLPPLAPPDALWSRIEQAIAPLPEEAEPAPARIAPRPRLAAPLTEEADEPAEVARLRRPLLMPRRVWPWQVATVGALALAAGVAAVTLVPSLALRLYPPELAARYAPQVAAMMPPDSHVTGFLAQARPDGTVVLTALDTIAVPPGRALELWMLPPGATAPKSLGVLPAAGRRVTLPRMPASGTALMVSIEPPGGSPTGLPTGPVVFAGKLEQMRL